MLNKMDPLEAEFEVEERKLTAKLELFQYVKDKKAEIETAKASMSAQSIEIDRLDKKRSAVLVDIDTLEQDHKHLEADHAVRKRDWSESVRSEGHSVFSFDVVASWVSTGKEIDLEAAAKLAEENANLLKQYVEMSRLTTLIETERVGRLHPISSQLENRQTFIGLSQGRLDSLDRELAYMEWKGRWAEATKDEATQQDIQKARTEEQGRLLPLAMAGAYIRGRKLEWVRDQIRVRQDDKIVDTGNQASHYGMAVADAALYQGVGPIKRTDLHVFMHLYGVHPDVVWKLRELKSFCDILDWRAGMMDFHGHTYKLGSFHSSPFNLILKDMMSSFPQHADEGYLASVSPQPELRQFYEKLSTEYPKLEKLYKNALTAHKAHLKTKKSLARDHDYD